MSIYTTDKKTMAAASRPVPFPQNRFELTVDFLGDIGYYTEVTGLSAQVDVLEYPEGGRNDYVHKLPTRIKHTNLTLKRGMTNEPKLLAWFKTSVVKAQPTSITVASFDSENNRLQTWSFKNAFPVKWTGPDLKAGGTDIMTESLEIAHHGIGNQ
jgi:phage tail-like protein